MEKKIMKKFMEKLNSPSILNKHSSIRHYLSFVNICQKLHWSRLDDLHALLFEQQPTTELL